MSKSIDFYFDFASPYSYLAHIKLPLLAQQYGATLHYHPIDVTTAKLAAGNYGPSNFDIPAKRRYLQQDLERWARRYQVPLRFANPGNTLHANIGTFYAVKAGSAAAYVRAVFHRLWGLGANDLRAVLNAAAQELDWDAPAFLAYVYSKAAQQEYLQACRAAYGRGVFGAPIMAVDDQMFWGNDRLAFLEAYLRGRDSGKRAAESGT